MCLLARFTHAATLIALALAAPACVEAPPDPGAGQAAVSPQEAAAILKRLMRSAAEDGSVSVIVPVRIREFVPEGFLRESGVQAQRREIARAQARALADVASDEVFDVHRFASIPYFTARATEPGLRVLADSLWVGQLTEEMNFKPTLEFASPIVHADEAHAAGATGAGYTVAIIDTGVDRDHPAFDGPGELRVVSEACFSKGGLCAGGATEDSGVGAAQPCAVKGCSHGTHVAGIAAGRPTAQYSGTGVAPDATIIAAMVASAEEDADVCGSPPPCVILPLSDVMKAMEWVYEQRDQYDIAAINLSLGLGEFEEHCNMYQGVDWQQSIWNLISVGIAVVASSGNDGFNDAIHMPACVASIVAVGATFNGVPLVDVDDVPANSNSSDLVDLLAPGWFVTSAVPGGDYGVNSGTSMATPMVTGAYAVLREANPDATPHWIRLTLGFTGTPIEDEDNGVVRSRIHIEAARQHVATNIPPVLTWSPP